MKTILIYTLIFIVYIILIVTWNGCHFTADWDRDGLINVQDKCPNQPGPSDNCGCPMPGFQFTVALDLSDRCVKDPFCRRNDSTLIALIYDEFLSKIKTTGYSKSLGSSFTVKIIDQEGFDYSSYVTNLHFSLSEKDSMKNMRSLEDALTNFKNKLIKNISNLYHYAIYNNNGQIRSRGEFKGCDVYNFFNNDFEKVIIKKENYSSDSSVSNYFFIITDGEFYVEQYKRNTDLVWRNVDKKFPSNQIAMLICEMVFSKQRDSQDSLIEKWKNYLQNMGLVKVGFLDAINKSGPPDIQRELGFVLKN